MFKSIDYDSQKASPRSFTGPLTDLQASLLYAMQKTEEMPYFEETNDLTTYTDKAMVIERMSVGKTYVCIALVAEGCLRSDVDFPGGDWYGERNYNRSLVALLQQVDFIELPWTLYVTDSDGIAHVKDYAEKYSNMSVVTVSSTKDLDAFDPFSKVDLVLVKHGTYKGKDGREYLLKAVKKKLEGYKIRRMIVDNFDTLRLTYHDQLICAHFTWLIANRVRNCFGNIKINTNPNLEDFIYEDYYDNPIIQVCKDRIIQMHFTLGFNRKFVEKSISMPEVTEVFYIVGVPKTVLRTNMIFLCYLLLEKYAADIDKLLYARSIVNQLQGKSAGLKDLVKKLTFTLRLKKPATLDSDNIADLSDVACQKITGDLQKIALPITRLVDHITDDECKCCLMPFESNVDDVSVLHCCQAVICNSCSNVGLEKCPICRSKIGTNTKSMIRLSEITRVDVDDLFDNFHTVSYSKWNPLLRTIVNVVTIKDLDMDGITKGKQGSYIKDFVTIGQRSVPCNVHRWAVYTTQKLEFIVKRELRVNNLDVTVVTSLRKLESPGLITDLLLVGIVGSADRRRIVSAVYNCTDREYNLNVVRIETARPR